jgi:F-type H+-transporting ATPase subunit alpha
LRRPPGREAYPGDIFYLHARLLERACKLVPPSSPPAEGREGGSLPPVGGREGGPLPPVGGKEGGSLTALPIAETQRGNIVAYIPTNLICATDTRIVLDSDLFDRGVKPAVSVQQSVSRVGGASQTAAMRVVARRLSLQLAQFEEVARFARFGIEVDEATQRQIRRGERLRAVLTQPAHQPLPLAAQVVVLLAATEGYLDDVALEDVPAFERDLLAHLEARYPGVLHQLDRSGELTAEIRGALDEAIAAARAEWTGGAVLGGAGGPAEGRSGR